MNSRKAQDPARYRPTNCGIRLRSSWRFSPPFLRCPDSEASGTELEHHPVDVDGLFNVLDRLEAHVLEAQLDLVLDLAEGAPGNEHPAVFRQGLDAGRHVHAFAVDVAVLRHDDVSDVDPDPELDLPLCGDFLLEVRHGALDLGRALHRVHGAGELSQQPVAGAFDDAAVVIRDRGIDQLGAVGLLARQGPGLVAFHEARVPDHVQREYGGEPAFHPFPPGGVGWTTFTQKRDRIIRVILCNCAHIRDFG